MKEIEEEARQVYSEMMQALINISGHLHLVQGWYDVLYPIKNYLAQYDSTLLYRMSEVFGKAKILNKQIAKTFVNDDEKSKDLIYEQIGKSISEMANMSFEKRKDFIDELGKLGEKYK